MIRTLVVIVACLVVTEVFVPELAFGEADARLCYNALCCEDIKSFDSD